MLRRKYRINVVDDLADVSQTDSKLNALNPEERQLFDYFTDPKRNNVNNNVVRALLADALKTKQISGLNWMTLTNNVRAGDSDATRAAEWNIGRKLGKLGVKIDQSLTISQKNVAVKPSITSVTAPAGIEGADAKAFEKIVSKTNANKRAMVTAILSRAFSEKSKKLGGQPHKPGSNIVTISPEETNKLVVNTAMRQADIGRLLGPLGIGLSL